VASDNTVQLDHILPWSRSGEDSFVNKTLCFAKANQDKKGRTPFEWFGKDELRWLKFVECVESSKAMKGRKKRNYLLKDGAVLEEKFRPRNLNDTRYAARLLLNILKSEYPQSEVCARPGPLTDRLRRGWGLQNLKKGPDGKRVNDDRHHALDALVVSATSNGQLQKLTRAFQEAERRGSHRDFSDLDPPWPGFFEETKEKLGKVFVSRAERRRARGEAHAATVRQIAERNGATVVFERKAVADITLNDLERIKDPERNHKVVASLRAWIDAGKPKDRLPLSPKGDPIRKVRLETNKKVDVLIRDGAAERGEMVRVDVFRKKNKKGAWEFFLVPVYPHDVFRGDGVVPPNKAIQAYKPEAQWPDMNSGHEFMWSLYPFSYVEVQKSDGTFIDGYFRGAHRLTGALNISPHHSRDIVAEGIGARTLKKFDKCVVDRLGRRFDVERELRTWRGEVCT
jgi:CRISPR-associated endonuclease Csn1